MTRTSDADRVGMLDTSVLIAQESGRQLDASALPEHLAISVITIAELQVGVLAAADTETRSRRLATLDAASVVEPLPVTADAARHWAALRTRLAELGLRAKINDLWIAAIAASEDLPIATQDDDFDAIERAGGPRVIHV